VSERVVVTGLMTQKLSIVGILFGSLLGGLAVGCEPGGVGDPCVPEDEYQPTFSGFSVEEVNVESKSFQCVTRICLVNHFRGRVSCPYGNSQSSANMGQAAPPPDCIIPGDPTARIEAAVDPQLTERRADDAVYCSCRCDGPDANARYCECPSGFSCVRLVEELGIGDRGQLAGSYCVREGTAYNKFEVDVNNSCQYADRDVPDGEQNCGQVNDFGEPAD